MGISLTQIQVLNAPQIPGLSFRGFRGEIDFQGMADIIASTREADQIERADTAEDIQKSYQHLNNCDPDADMLFAEINGQMVGYSRVTWYLDEGSRLRIYQSFGFIRPEWRRQGIGRAMLKYNQQHLRQIAAGHPLDFERSFESFADDTAKESTSLLVADGYQPARHFYLMVRPDLENIPDLPLPEGLEVRPVRAEDCRKVWDAANEAFRDHWGFTQQTEEDYLNFKNSRNFQPEHWQVAWAGDEVAGSIQAYIDIQENAEYHRKRGWTEGISTCRPWRRRGLAAALIARTLQHFKQLGMQESALGVDTENLTGALRLYERMGFQMKKRSTNYRKPVD
jgi:mycothiol synthase